MSSATDTGGAREGVVRSSATVMLTYAGTAGFTAVLTLYLVRALSPAEYGFFSLALAISGLVGLAADFGISASAARFMAEKVADRPALAALFAAGGRLKLGVAGAVAALLGLLAGPIADAYDQPGLAWPLRGMALAMFFQSLMAQFGTSFIAIGRSGANLRMVVSESAIELSATVALVAMGGAAGGAAFGRAIGYAAGALLGLALAVRMLGRRAAAFHRPGGVHLARMGRYALTLWLVNGAYAVFTYIDTLVIGAILGATAVGVFSAPMRLTSLLVYPALAVANAVSPRVASTPPDHEIVQRACRWLIILQASMMAPLVVWADPIVHVVLGDAYDDSVPVLRAIAPFVFLQGLAALLSLSVNYVGQARRRLPWAVGAVVINLAIDLALLREIGVVAAAIGTSVAYALYVWGHGRICGDVLGLRVRPLAATFARSAVAAAAMAGVLAAVGTRDLSWLEWAAGLAGGSLAFAAVLVAAREVRWGDLRRGPALVRARLGGGG